MGWILFIDEKGAHCAWPDAITRMSPIADGDGIVLEAGTKSSTPQETPQHTNDFEQAVMWVEEDVEGMDEEGPPEEDDEV
jgi:hypothetical protein